MRRGPILHNLQDKDISPVNQGLSMWGYVVNFKCVVVMYCMRKLCIVFMVAFWISGVLGNYCGEFLRYDKIKSFG